MLSLAVSVVIPTYNRAHLIVRAVESVLAQMRAEDELIVIDDGSTDNTAEVLAAYRGRLRYIQAPNGGAGAARNRGLREATKPLLTFLDSDDEWMPGHLDLLREVMAARSELLYCYTNFRTEFRDGTVRPFALETQEDRELNWDEIVGPAQPLSAWMPLPAGATDCPCHECVNLYRSQLRTNYVSVDTLIVRRELIEARVRFAEDTSTAEEWEFSSQLTGHGKGVYLHCETTLVHQHTGQQLTDLDMLELATARITIMQRVWGADPEFLSQYGDYYYQRLREEQVYRVGRLILRGDTRAARTELSRINHPPLPLAVLAALPGSLAKGILDGRRAVRTLLRRHN